MSLSPWWLLTMYPRCNTFIPREYLPVWGFFTRYPHLWKVLRML